MREASAWSAARSSRLLRSRPADGNGDTNDFFRGYRPARHPPAVLERGVAEPPDAELRGTSAIAHALRSARHRARPPGWTGLAESRRLSVPEDPGPRRAGPPACEFRGSGPQVLRQAADGSGSAACSGLRAGAGPAAGDCRGRANALQRGVRVGTDEEPGDRTPAPRALLLVRWVQLGLRRGPGDRRRQDSRGGIARSIHYGPSLGLHETAR